MWLCYFYEFHFKNVCSFSRRWHWKQLENIRQWKFHQVARSLLPCCICSAVYMALYMWCHRHGTIDAVLYMWHCIHSTVYACRICGAVYAAPCMQHCIHSTIYAVQYMQHCIHSIVYMMPYTQHHICMLYMPQGYQRLLKAPKTSSGPRSQRGSGWGG